MRKFDVDVMATCRDLPSNVLALTKQQTGGFLDSNQINSVEMSTGRHQKGVVKIYRKRGTCAVGRNLFNFV